MTASVSGGRVAPPANSKGGFTQGKLVIKDEAAASRTDIRAFGGYSSRVVRSMYESMKSHHDNQSKSISINALMPLLEVIGICDGSPSMSDDIDKYVQRQ